MIEVIIDGANVAFINGTRKRLAKRIENALGHLDPKVDCVKAVLPSYYNCEKGKNRFQDPELLETLVRNRQVELVNGDDDYAMIQYCVEYDAYLLTNDQFKKERKEEWWASRHTQWAKTHLLTYSIINDQLILSKKSEKFLQEAPSKPQYTLQNLDETKVIV